MVDRFGLSFRATLIGGVLAHLTELDVLEVLLDELVGAPSRVMRAMQALAREKPLILHGVSMGLSGAEGIAPHRIERAARLVDKLGAEAFSEHLAFVRAGGVEIGHMAAPPRGAASVESTCRNLAHIRRVLGGATIAENIASLLIPPLSTLDEPSWLNQIARESGTPLLLDLHNFYANAVATKSDPFEMLAMLDVTRVSHVHLAGGRPLQTRSGQTRILDDHLHAVPPICYEMLEALASRVTTDLTVILERDGQFPPFSETMNELRLAREAVARGRGRTLSLSA